MRTDFMASAKQIAWRKKFARMSKAGKFKKSNKVQKAYEDLKSKGLTAKPKKLSKAFERKYKPKTDKYDMTKPIVHPKNFTPLKGRDNMAYVEHQPNGKYSVVTYRKHSTPQVFVHKNFEKKRAIDYVDSFNFLNKDT